MLLLVGCKETNKYHSNFKNILDTGTLKINCSNMCFEEAEDSSLYYLLLVEYS